MQLIYLYVEEYKSIREQGFNFSKQFACSYDKDKQELTIKKNDDYIESFFDENIEVTAIVGENGAGKSSIFKLVLMLIYFQQFCFSDKSAYFDENALIAIREFVNKNLFLIVRVDGENYRISMKDIIKSLSISHADLDRYLPSEIIDIDSCSHTGIERISEVNFSTFFVHFNYMLDTLYDSESDYWVKNIYHKADSYETPLLLEPYKNHNNGQIINLDIINYLSSQNLLRFYGNLETEKNIFEFFTPNFVSFGYITREHNWGELADDEFELFVKFRHLVSYKFFQLLENSSFLSLQGFELKKGGLYFNEVKGIGDWLESLYEQKNYKLITELYLLFKVLESYDGREQNKLFNKKELDKVLSWADELNGVDSIGNLPSIDYNALINPSAPNYEIRKIENCIKFLNKELYENEFFIKLIDKKFNTKNKIESVKEFLPFIPPWLGVEFYEGNKSLSSLSSGEKSFFTFFINLLYQVQNINDRGEYREINIFLDEIELGFHPQWQKMFLSHLIKATSLVNTKKMNLYIATHSPFILSDIPNQNIVFLKDGKQVDAFEKKNTFGANIHTLLSDGFFMQNGLIGEFARNKIEEVVRFLNNKNSDVIKTEEEAQKIINLIGEPILKRELQRMLDSKNLSQVELIKKEIEALEKRVKEIENGTTNS